MALVHPEVVGDLVEHRAPDLVPGRVGLAKDHDPLDPARRVVDAHQSVGMAVLDDHGDAVELGRDLVG